MSLTNVSTTDLAYVFFFFFVQFGIDADDKVVGCINAFFWKKIINRISAQLSYSSIRIKTFTFSISIYTRTDILLDTVNFNVCIKIFYFTKLY